MQKYQNNQIELINYINIENSLILKGFYSETIIKIMKVKFLPKIEKESKGT